MKFLIVENCKYIYAYDHLLTIRKSKKEDSEWEPSEESYMNYVGDYSRNDYEIYSEEEARVLLGNDSVNEANTLMQKTVKTFLKR